MSRASAPPTDPVHGPALSSGPSASRMCAFGSTSARAAGLTPSPKASASASTVIRVEVVWASLPELRTMLNVCVAGATGWTGRALVAGVLEADDLALRSAVSRSAAGEEIGGAPVYASAAEALNGV